MIVIEVVRIASHGMGERTFQVLEIATGFPFVLKDRPGLSQRFLIGRAGEVICLIEQVKRPVEFGGCRQIRIFIGTECMDLGPLQLFLLI